MTVKHADFEKENKILQNNFIADGHYNPAETHIRHGRNRHEYKTHRGLSAKYATRQDTAPSGAQPSNRVYEGSLTRIVSEPRII